MWSDVLVGPLTNVDAYGPAAIAEIVTGRHVLPVLDGLDEMPPAARAAAIRELNQLPLDLPFILTSRTQEYTAAIAHAGDPLRAVPVIELKPVSSRAALAYLARTNSRWRAVSQRLRAEPESPLAVALSTRS